MNAPVTVPALTEHELAALRSIRLRNRWSFRKMAALVDLPETTLKSVLRGERKAAHDTTVFAIRDWMSKNPELVADAGAEGER